MEDDGIKSTCTGRCQDHLSRQSIKAERGGYDSLPRQQDPEQERPLTAGWIKKVFASSSGVLPVYVTDALFCPF